MIFVDRLKVPIPDVLLSLRAKKERERVQLLLGSASPDHLNQLRVTFAGNLWEQARPALSNLFGNKCAYCESRLMPGVGNIEHFRPRQGAADLQRSRLQLYYSWLAYDWDNLLLVCPLCSRSKLNFFPTLGTRARIGATLQECRETENGLIDPTFDNPSEHFRFSREGICVGVSARGRLTIEVIGLNREGLVEARGRAWETALFRTRLKLMTPPYTLDKVEIERNLLGNLEYSAVVRTAMKEAADQLRADLSPLVLDTPKKADNDPVPELRPLPHRYTGRRRLPINAHKRLRRIEVRNFKVIEQIDFDIHSTENNDAGALMIVGENGTGKSTILEAVGLVLAGGDQIKRLRLRPEDYLLRRESWGAPASDSPPAEVRAYFEDLTEPLTLRIESQSSGFLTSANATIVLLSYGPRRFFVNTGRGSRNRGAKVSIQTLFDPLALVADPTRWLLECPDDKFSLAVRALRQLLGLPDEAKVKRVKDGQERIVLELDGNVTPLTRLSEGYKTIVATAVDIMREMLLYWPDLETARGVVLIDEVETHLHPRWKMRIMERLRGAMPQVQFIATTHDPLCLRGLHNDEAQVLRRNDNDVVEQLRDLPNVRGLSVEQLLTSEFFGLYSTEDPSLEEKLTNYVALATKRDRSPVEEDELARYRDATRDVVRLGSTPATQLIQDAATEYLAQSSRTDRDESGVSRKDAVNKIVEIWKSLE